MRKLSNRTPTQVVSVKVKVVSLGSIPTSTQSAEVVWCHLKVRQTVLPRVHSKSLYMSPSPFRSGCATKGPLQMSLSCRSLGFGRMVVRFIFGYFEALKALRLHWSTWGISPRGCEYIELSNGSKWITEIDLPYSAVSLPILWKSSSEHLLFHLSGEENTVRIKILYVCVSAEVRQSECTGHVRNMTADQKEHEKGTQTLWWLLAHKQSFSLTGWQSKLARPGLSLSHTCITSGAQHDKRLL